MTSDVKDILRTWLPVVVAGALAWVATIATTEARVDSLERQQIYAIDTFVRIDARLNSIDQRLARIEGQLTK